MRMEKGADHFEMNIVGWEFPELARKGNLSEDWLMLHLNIQVGDDYIIVNEPLLLEEEWDTIIEAMHTMVRRSFETPSTESLALEEVPASTEVMFLSFLEPALTIEFRVVGEGYLTTQWNFEYHLPGSEKTVFLYFHKEMSAKEMNDLVFAMMEEKGKLD